MTSVKQIVINLDEKHDAHVVPNPDDLIYLKEYDRIKELLKRSLVSAKEYTEKKENGESDLLRVRKHDSRPTADARRPFVRASPA